MLAFFWGGEVISIYIDVLELYRAQSSRAMAVFSRCQTAESLSIRPLTDLSPMLLYAKGVFNLDLESRLRLSRPRGHPLGNGVARTHAKGFQGVG